MRSSAGPSPVEHPVYFAAGSETLMGVLTTASEPTHDVAALLATGGWHGTHTDRNRWFVDLARSLAVELGVASLRFDYHGVGESTGQPGRFRLDEPYTTDVCAAYDCLRAQGFARVLGVGHCFGAHSLLSALSEQRSMEGVALISMPLVRHAAGTPKIAQVIRHTSRRELARRALRPSSLATLGDANVRRGYLKAAKTLIPSPSRGRAGPISRRQPTIGLDALRQALRTDVRVLLAYGDGDPEFLDAQGVLHELEEVMSTSDALSTQLFNATALDFSRLDLQRELHDAIVDWSRVTLVGAGT